MLILNYFIPKAISTTVPDERDTPKWLYNAQQILSRPGINVHFLKHLQRKVVEAKIPDNHPILGKIQEAFSKFRFSTVPSLLESISQESHIMNLPIISGNILDVHCTLAAIKLIIKRDGDRFKTIILHDFDDEVVSLIVEYCPNVESLQLRAGYGSSQLFSDEGLVHIAKLKKIQELVIVSPLSFQVTSKGFEILLNTPILQSNLVALTLNYGPNDKELQLLTKFKSLKFLSLFSYDITTQGLLALLQSNNLKATLEQLRFVIKYSKAFLNDQILTELSAYTHLQSIYLDSKWQVSDPVFINFLNAKKKANLPFHQRLYLKR